MHSILKTSQSHAFRVLLRRSSSIKNSSVVKVLSEEEDQTVRVSFKYYNSPFLKLKAPKSESVHKMLSRIRVMVTYQQKKEEMRQYINNLSLEDSKLQTSSTNIDVDLIQNNKPLDTNLPNHDAWTLASSLKIGDTYYEVNYNKPSLTILSLPDFIISGCAIRPHILFECARLKDSKFYWYRSISKESAVIKSKEGKAEVLFDDEQCWLKVAEGFTYFTSSEDTGHFLKVVCTPGLDDKVGRNCSVQSIGVVEPALKMFPFEERQMHTQSFCDNSSVRCVSYNVLANMYVEAKKFPYTSLKARDIYYRKQVLIKELIGYNSDIICLQEVQDRMFEYDLFPVFFELGYTGYYKRKGGRRHEGLAIFIRSSKFKIVKEHGVLLNQIIKEQDIYNDLLTKVGRNYEDMSKLLLQHTVLQLSLLQNINSPEHQLLIANTHLYSNKDKPEVRLIQAAVCTHYIEHFLKTQKLQSTPVLFCGDFNSLPDSETVNLITSGNYECCPSWHKDTDASADTILRHNLCLDSACGTPEYTNYTEEFQGCLDYIFYSKNLMNVTEVVPMPRHEYVVENVALPSELFPSDHIALICTLQWNQS